MRRSAFLLVTFLLALGVRGSAQTDGYRIVVNPANPTASLTRAEVSRLFLKKTAKWKDGQAVLPVDQERVSPVRQAFSASVHEKDVDAISSYWQVLVFSGRDVPPRIVKSDAEVLQFVRDNPGAVGYVSEQGPVPGVKVVSVR
jgi:ABC-type phosphate transport system substrate-binding protein